MTERLQLEVHPAESAERTAVDVLSVPQTLVRHKKKVIVTFVAILGSVVAFVLLALTGTDLVPRHHMLVHNFTDRLSINAIADRFQKLWLNVEVMHLENPRKEPEACRHRDIEVHEAVANAHKNKRARLNKELVRLASLAQMYKRNIDTAIIMPQVVWAKGRGDNHPQRKCVGTQGDRKHWRRLTDELAK